MRHSSGGGNAECSKAVFKCSNCSSTWGAQAIGKYTQALVLNLLEYDRIFFWEFTNIVLKKKGDTNLLGLKGLYKHFFNPFRLDTYKEF